MLHSIDPNKVTFDEALELVVQFYKSFENDNVINKGIPDDFVFANLTDRLVSIYSPTERLAKTVQLAKNYKNKMMAAGWTFYALLLEPENRGFLFYEGDRCVGCSLWRLSRYDVPRQTWWQIVRKWVRKLSAMVRAFYYLPFGVHKFYSVPKADYYQRIRSESKFTETEEQYKELAHKSWDELKTIQYPIKAVAYCDAFCTTVQRKGYGSKYFPLVLEALPCNEAVFKDGEVESRGPPKFGLTATEAGRGLYLRYGFKETIPVTQQVDGQPRTGVLMFKVLTASQKDPFV